MSDIDDICACIRQKRRVSTIIGQITRYSGLERRSISALWMSVEDVEDDRLILSLVAPQHIRQTILSTLRPHRWRASKVTYVIFIEAVLETRELLGLEVRGVQQA